MSDSECDVPLAVKRLVAERLEYNVVEKPNKEATMHGDAQALKRRWSCLKDLGARPVGLERTLILHLTFDRTAMRYRPVIISSDSTILPPKGKFGSDLVDLRETVMGLPAGGLEASAQKVAQAQTQALDDLICSAAVRTRNPQPPHLFRIRDAVRSILTQPLKLACCEPKAGEQIWEEGNGDA
jgi:hypothetical protein